MFLLWRVPKSKIESGQLLTFSSWMTGLLSFAMVTICTLSLYADHYCKSGVIIHILIYSRQCLPLHWGEYLKTFVFSKEDQICRMVWQLSWTDFRELIRPIKERSRFSLRINQSPNSVVEVIFCEEVGWCDKMIHYIPAIKDKLIIMKLSFPKVRTLTCKHSSKVPV